MNRRRGCRPVGGFQKLEARIGIEPMYKDFADPRLTTWLPRLISHPT